MVVVVGLPPGSGAGSCSGLSRPWCSSARRAPTRKASGAAERELPRSSGVMSGSARSRRMRGRPGTEHRRARGTEYFVAITVLVGSKASGASRPNPSCFRFPSQPPVAVIRVESAKRPSPGDHGEPLSSLRTYPCTGGIFPPEPDFPAGRLRLDNRRRIR
jgi:hypothetical protein